MTTAQIAFIHPNLAHFRTAEDIAYHHGVIPNTENWDLYVGRLLYNGRSEYQEVLSVFFEAFLVVMRKEAKNNAPHAVELLENEQLIDEAYSEWMYSASLDVYCLDQCASIYPTTRDIVEGKERWPTGRAFRFAQWGWLASTWVLVPAFPAAMLSFMGFRLSGPTRWAGDVPEEEWRKFHQLCGQKLQHKLPEPEKYWIKDFLEHCPIGGELPILDIDTIHKERDDQDPCEAVGIALSATKAFKEVTGLTPRWTVTNNQGGLHGRFRYMCAAQCGMDLHRAIRWRIINIAKVHKLITSDETRRLSKGSEADKQVLSQLDYHLDLIPYNKSAYGHMGVWRLPGCKKSKKGSLPQESVEDHIAAMPWLERLTQKEIHKMIGGQQ